MLSTMSYRLPAIVGYPMDASRVPHGIDGIRVLTAPLIAISRLYAYDSDSPPAFLGSMALFIETFHVMLLACDAPTLAIADCFYDYIAQPFLKKWGA